MHSIQMVDLVSQHQKIRTEIDAAIGNIIDKAWFIKGGPVRDFEEQLSQYLGVNKVVGCANGTDALQAAFMALELPKGAEVIVPDFTFIATAEVLALLDLTPVFVDVEAETFNMDPVKVERAITDKTKAIVPVHMFGLPCNMEAIMNLAEKHDLYVVEDAAQAMGSEYTFSDGTTKKSGAIGHIGCTSFFPSKNLSCMGDGGAVFTNDEVLGKRIEQMCNHGMQDAYSYKYVGINSRLDALQASVLSVKLPRLDEYNAARKKAAEAYTAALSGIEQIELPVESESSKHVYHQYTLKIKDGSRNDLEAHLKSKGIPTKIYYPIPFHAHAPYNHFPFDEEQLENSLWLCDHVLSLPMHTEISAEQMAYITNSVIDFYQNN